jgi:hypothetical protein
MKIEFGDVLFNDFYKTNKSKFIENLILWSAVDNPECNEEIFNSILELQPEYNKKGLTSNYMGNRTSNYTLQPVDEVNLKQLIEAFEELDGTLLSDIVSKYMETHKIF